MVGNRGFTLIELLIVIAIIAILALIATPNFLEAQARARVVRTRADMRAVVDALETYRIDQAAYPPPRTNQGWFFARIHLTTPMAYLSGEAAFVDTFGASLEENIETGNFLLRKTPGFIRYYAFNQIGNNTNALDDMLIFYVLAGNGPDRERYPNVGARISNSDEDEADFDDILNQVYAPTNGTVSTGEILRFGAGPAPGAQRIRGISERAG